MKNFATFLFILFFATTGHAEVNGEISDEYPNVKSAFNLTHDMDLINVMTFCSYAYIITENKDLVFSASSFVDALSSYQLANKTMSERTADYERLKAVSSEIEQIINKGGISRPILLTKCGLVDKKN